MLLQVLGVWFGIAAAIGNTIAAGVVAAQGYIAKLLPGDSRSGAGKFHGFLLLAGAASDRVNTPWALAMLIASYPIFRVMKLFSRRASV
jgi:hypothetical protein